MEKPINTFGQKKEQGGVGNGIMRLWPDTRENFKKKIGVNVTNWEKKM
jgi:hypothetical protein